MSMNVATHSYARFSTSDVEDTRRLHGAEKYAKSIARTSGRPCLLVYNSHRGELERGIVRLFSAHGRDFVSTLETGYIVIPFDRVTDVQMEIASLRKRMIDGDSWNEGASILLRGFDATGGVIRS